MQNASIPSDAGERENSTDRLVPLSEDERAELERFRRTHETQVLTIFFSDLVGSTKLQTEQGNLAATDLVYRHYRIVRDALRSFDGREIKTAGDSMLIVFAAPSEAIKFALVAQRSMREHAMTERHLPPMRAGVHQGQVVLEKDRGGATVVDIYGLQVSTAARIMDLAEAGQILLSRSVFDDARAILRQEDFAGFARLAWRNHGHYRFKGVEDDHEVCEVGEDGLAPLTPPKASLKGWPAERTLEEPGWRPAAGITVPETNWQLVTKLGEGEFGEVWKAFNLSDKSYQVFKFCFKRDRLPALKREARLLKRLRKYAHPSLVEVYDVTEGERPPHYLEMEYVDGPAMHEWLKENPPLDQRLEAIAQVADALDTVHAAGIFHRDIKPPNILLTRREDGALRAKLGDFGLGAAEDPDLLKSIYTSRIKGLSGTWDYLAPELRHGGIASAQSDIFSLGMTLYQVTVGDVERPLTADWEQQISSEVLRDDIRRCICQSPQDRWPRAAELAQALRSHDQRLEQRRLEREHQAQRTKVRRFRRAAMLAAGMVAILLVVGGIALYQWREAARQRDRAVAQKRLALDAISRLTHDVPLQLRDIPGTLPIMRQLLEENLNLIDRILAIEPNTPQAQRERGVNFVSIGDRWMLIGDTDRASTAFAEGLKIAKRLASDYPHEIVYRHDVSIAYDRIGSVQLAKGNVAEALRTFQTSMDMTREMAGRAPDDRGNRRDLWLGLDRLGGVYLRLGRTDDARKAYEEAMAIAEKLVKEDPSDETAARDLSLCLERIGDVRMQLGQNEEALAAYERGMEMGRQDAARRPDSEESLRNMSVGWDKLGTAYLKLGRKDAAVNAYREALKISQSLAAKDPENSQLQRDLSISNDRLADLALDVNKPDEALRLYESGLAISRRMAEKDQGSASIQFDLLVGSTKVGNAHLAMGSPQKALSNYREALDIGRRLTQQDPADAEVKRSLSVLLNKTAGIQMQLEETAAAAASIEESIGLARQNATSDPNNMRAQRDLGVSYIKSLPIFEKAGNPERLREAIQGAPRQFEKVFAASPKDAVAKDDLVAALTAGCYTTLARRSATPEDLQAAITLAKRLAEIAGPDSSDAQKLLAQLQAKISPK